jgi:nucleotide-binding universal stress UspA family protein
MKKILVPCDFSEPSREAFAFAIQLAARSRGEVQVLHVINVPVSYNGLFVTKPYSAEHDRFYKVLEQEALKNYDQLRASVKAEGIVIGFTVLQGPVAPLISDFISTQNIDQVVMGTHGASGLKEYFVGSNTEKIVRSSPVPVLAIKKSLPLTSVSNVVFASSLELNQTDLMDKLKKLQEFLNARIHVLFINTPSGFKKDIETKEALKDFAIHYNLKNYELHVGNDIDEPDGILRFAAEINADMIAIGTHRRRGIAHWLTGSIAEDVVNHLHCAVWTYAIRKADS